MTGERLHLVRVPAAADHTSAADELAATIRSLRSRYTGANQLAARVLAGDVEALHEAHRISEERSAIVRLLEETFGIDDTGEVVEQLLDIVPVIDAMLVATGEWDSDDPIVNERFRPARLEFHRQLATRHLAEIESKAKGRPFTASELALHDQCTADLAAISRGEEPA